MRAKAIADVEIVDENNEFFEAAEVKHNIPIDAIMIEDAYQKFKDTPIGRYYLLTTAEPYIKEGDEGEVAEVIEKIKTDHGCEVIVNGIVPSLKYYLRLLRNPSEFIARYTQNLESQFSQTTDIKRQHIEAWRKITKTKLD